MIEFVILLLILYGMLLIHDIRRLKAAQTRERIIYALLLLVTLLMSVECVWQAKFFGLYDLAELVFGPASREVANFLKPPSN